MKRMLVLAIVLVSTAYSAGAAETLLAHGTIAFPTHIGESDSWVRFLATDCADEWAPGERRDDEGWVMFNIEHLWGRTLRLRALEPDRKTLNPSGYHAVPVVAAEVGRQCDVIRYQSYTTHTDIWTREVTFVARGAWLQLRFGTRYHYMQPYELYLIE